MAVLIENLIKSADRNSINVGEEVTFSFVFESNQPATVQCTFTDSLPTCLAFVPDSLFFDGVNIPNANPITGFTFTHTRDVPAHRISFKARAICRPDDGVVVNVARVEYEFAGVPDITISNPVPIEITQLETCNAVGQQLVNVCLHVSVQPFARVGTITLRCCGAPIITPGTNICPGEPRMNCDFTISQRICVQVPVEFGANVRPGETHIQCAGESCANCPTDEDDDE